MAATFIDFRINNAEQFKESFSEPSPNTKVYLTFGKSDPWANDLDPDIANTTVSTIYNVWSNMIGGKKLSTSDVSHVIPRINWANNTVYSAYDHESSELFDSNTQFYVMTTDYNVYKCIANNNGTSSTVQPTSVNPGLYTQTSDGYIWKFMYQLSSADKLKFLTQNYIPVRYVNSDDGSLQWQVQESAVDGGIASIVVMDPGTGYSNSSNVLVTIRGDGQDAHATVSLNVSSNTIQSITINDQGRGYTEAIAEISGGGGSGANARIIISPPGGHGSDALYELGGKNLLINVRLNNSEEGSLPVSNDFRQIALIKDPYYQNTKVVFSNTTFTQYYTLDTTGSDNFIEDEIIYQGSSLATSTFSGRVLSFDNISGETLLINTKGIASSGSLTGQTSAAIRFLIEYDRGDLQPHSGKLLYVDQIEPVSRSSDQAEDFKILVKF